jgi:CRP/FNR family cyclic AMP-dependent transcriptional regulator
VDGPAPPALRENFLSRLSPDAAEDLRSLGARRRFPSGAIIFLEGDVAHEALVLLSGDLKVTLGSSEGREVVLDVFGPGTLLGEWSIIDGKPRSATVSALSAVEVLSVASAPFKDFLARHPQVLAGLLLDVIGRLRHQGRHQLEFGAGDALGRVCARLVELADRYGEREGDLVLISSPLSQSDLAAWTGLSREAVVKALRSLRQLGWIDNRGRAITIREMDRLRRRATH